ncbi:hypothetical protein HDU98_007095 [Podochytrium sp. JEL0797]|nr:hypothetical protein HDU98_007095 [Podochytrium sp. JEL0797]
MALKPRISPYHRSKSTRPTSTSTRIVVILDDSYPNLDYALQTAIDCLSKSANDRITIITIVQASEQHAALMNITSQLLTKKDLLHPQTKFNVLAVPENAVAMENTIYKLVARAQPQLMMLGLCKFYAASVFSYVKNAPIEATIILIEEKEALFFTVAALRAVTEPGLAEQIWIPYTSLVKNNPKASILA